VYSGPVLEIGSGQRRAKGGASEPHLSIVWGVGVRSLFHTVYKTSSEAYEVSKCKKKLKCVVAKRISVQC
jgi:hypothetical protein